MAFRIASGGRRRPTSRAEVAAQGTMWQRLAGTFGLTRTPEQRDQDEAERGEALAAFLRGEPVPRLWPEHLQPLFVHLHDETYAALLEAFRSGADHAVWLLGGSLLGLQKWAQMIDQSIALGAGALERLAQRHLRQTAAAEVAKEVERL